MQSLKTILSLLIGFLITAASFAADIASDQSAERQLLYLTSPDGAQRGGSGNGILIFDIDHAHSFVRRIEIPSMSGGVRGVCASAATKKLYYTTSKKLLGCLDLLTDKILWEKTYDMGCDRPAITPDGKTLYVPSGWWSKEHCWMVVDGATGDVITKIDSHTPSHNTLCSLDGSRAYLADQDELITVDTADNKVLSRITPVAGGHYPFTVNGAGTRAYICLFSEIGFQVADLRAGRVLETVHIDGPVQKRRTHGAGLTPDESELWISDQAANKLYVFDVTGTSPKQKEVVSVSNGAHGWIAFSHDGRYAYSASPEVIDAKSKKIVATLHDESGAPVCSSKFVEIDFHGSDVSQVGDQFGVGRVRKQ
jgi:DNA-binding beta-propeller fold protein YncE